ncbi:MAG: pitrilysin family protein [candidate division Zixibacteria bacterium]
MRKIILFTIMISLVFGITLLDAQEKQSTGSRVIANLEYPEIKWDVPEVGKEVTRAALDNGLILYFMENHELPLISAHALIKTGSIYDPKEMMAVAGITGNVMRTGGTKSYSPDSLNAILEFVAGSVESGIGSESGSASMSVMAKDLDSGLNILYEVLRYPTFDTAKIELEKSQIKESIRRRDDRPGSIVSREFSHLIYGDHPYGRILEWEYVKDIGRDDLVAYHGKYYHPNNIMIAFTGDFNTKKLGKKIKKIFGSWPIGKLAIPPEPAVEYGFNPGVYVIDKDLTQANIRVGHLGIKRDNPDKYAVSLMNFILGGGSFTSRLTTRVRSDEGLAYSVRSAFSTGSRDYGMFYAYSQTKTASAYRVLEIFNEEFKRIREEIPSQAEFETARDAYVNNFIFQFDSPGKIVNRLMNLEFDDYPPNYYNKYLDNVRSVTIEDIKTVAEKYLKPESMTIMVLADTSKIEADLSDFGKVTNLELKEPKVD